MATPHDSSDLYQSEVEVVRREELSDDEDNEGAYNYEMVPEVEDDDGISDDEDLAAALMSVAIKKGKNAATRSPCKSTASLDEAYEAKPVAHVRPAVIDDFIRKFLIKVGMSKTLNAFNTEWFELQSKGKLSEEYTDPVPDIYLRNQELDDNVQTMRQQLERMKEIAAKAQGTWDKFRKERDFHRMHHKRVVIEKNKLVTDLRRLQKHFDSYEPTLLELKRKYEVAMKEKMLTRLEKDRVKARVQSLEDQVRTLLEEKALAANNSREQVSKARASSPGPAPPQASPPSRSRKAAAARLPATDAVNPLADLVFDPVEAEHYALKKTFRGHLNAIATVVFHPRKPVFATVSDDETWKLWAVPGCDLIMSGEGHTEWLAGVDFHPSGTHLATGSGDTTVKVWEFAGAACKATLTDHTQAVWGVAYHHTGDFLASCSMDHTARLWDLMVGRCRQTFRGHVDSVNALCWQPYTSNLCTGSGDKTVSMWDARTGLCIQTFYGHLNACNNVATNKRGDTVASCDADGVVKLWDVRMVSEIGTLETGYYPINQVTFDRSGQRLACASDDGTIKVYDTHSKSLLTELRGHEDAVQAVQFDPSDKMMVSASSDCTFRIWGT